MSHLYSSSYLSPQDGNRCNKIGLLFMETAYSKVRILNVKITMAFFPISEATRWWLLWGQDGNGVAQWHPLGKT